jgi:hypothetical protein
VLHQIGGLNPVLFFNILGRGEVREKVEGQQYTSIVPLLMGATVHKLGRKYQIWVNVFPVHKICWTHAAKSVNSPILKKRRHLGFGVFMVPLSMLICSHCTKLTTIFLSSKIIVVNVQDRTGYRASPCGLTPGPTGRMCRAGPTGTGNAQAYFTGCCLPLPHPPSYRRREGR